MGGFTESDSWLKLKDHFDKIKDVHLREHFADDDLRADWFSMEVGGWFYDYSKNCLTRETLELLLSLARERGVESHRDSMFAGEKINTTEDRAVLHVALRNPADSHVTVDDEDVVPEIRHTMARMSAFTEAIHSGSWRGYTGRRIKNIVNIGIGGSDLGPRMTVQALKAFHIAGLNLRFVSNVDPADFHESVVSDLDPEETLFIIVSKTFTTDETMTNALSARIWIADSMSDQAVDSHFIAVSTSQDRVESFGILQTNMFPFWDWVGGRYSLTSAAGLSLMLAIGVPRFQQFLDGFYHIDEHFRSAPLEENMPVLMAMISVWYSSFAGSSSELLAPYSQSMSSFPSYIQQMSMESNGKMTTTEGQPVYYQTAPVVWGQAGTNAQHSYFQLLHQGTHIIPVDFIGFIEANHPRGEHQRKLLANMIGQAEGLAFGRTIGQLEEMGVEGDSLIHRAVPGNRPSSILLARQLTPYNLGQLIALYEHKTFVQGVIWGVNSFDQWGVELGKGLAKDIYSELKDIMKHGDHDQSTENIIRKIRN